MKKRAFLIINSLYGGGAERVASRLSVPWAQKYDLFVISLSSKSEYDYKFDGTIIYLDKVYEGSNWIKKNKNAAKEIDSLAEKFEPQVMVSFLQNANLCLMMTKYQCKKIISIRNYIRKQYEGIKLILWKILIMLYFNKAQYVVSVSKQINEEMSQYFHLPAPKCKCIYNPYNIDEIQELGKEELELEEKYFYDSHQSIICTMGKVSPQKGQFHLVRILKQLNRESCQYGLVIIGDDSNEYANKIKELIEKCGVARDVLFTGQKNNPYKYISKSKCFVFPSKYEGFPNALVEAMACAVPVISSDCDSGPREILVHNEEQFGYLISNEPNKWLNENEPLTEVENEYKRIISMVCKDSKKNAQLSCKAVCRAREFNLSHISSQWDELML